MRDICKYLIPMCTVVQECGAISWLESDEKEQLASALAAVDQWLSSCRDSLATVSTDPALSLQELISQVKCLSIWNLLANDCCNYQYYPSSPNKFPILMLMKLGRQALGFSFVL